MKTTDQRVSHLTFLLLSLGTFISCRAEEQGEGCVLQAGGLSRVSRKDRIETFYSERGFTRQGLMLQCLSSPPCEPVKLGIKFAVCDFFFSFSSAAKSLSIFPFLKSEKKNGDLSDCLRNGISGNWDGELERWLSAPPRI